MTDFERLGLFYLGRRRDLAARVTLDELVLYDSRDLVTHALCVGMTGSGKTGLGITLVEEAAIDGVPVLVIDPKGDLGNLLLTFPSLSAAEFQPWVDPDEARRAGLEVEAFAAREAETWAAGLAAWGQDGARIERLRNAADFTVLTPGSRAGRPVSILSSFAAPPPGDRGDAEVIAERASGTATSALVLAGVDAAARSREHSLVAAILTEAWQRGEDLDFAGLIRRIQRPRFETIGVLDLESFFSARDRFELATRLNGALAAPGFDAWLDGEPLDPQSLLYTAEGRQRVTILSLAHLGDAERMFFVSLLLAQVVSWMRRQTGTTSLRALVYMDEIFGFFPPVANPPSKLPLLTLLKQGRAHGLGVMLATQNPVDLDYKALGNIGTWFLGRLQTERDKARLLDGLEGAAGSLNRQEADRTLSALDKRVFLMHNVHEAAPIVFETRWAMSYLRGPLSREQIRALQGDRLPAGLPPSAPFAQSFRAAPGNSRTYDSPVVPDTLAAPAPLDSSDSAAAPQPPGAPERPGTSSGLTARPILPPGIRELFLPAATAARVVYRPVILGSARVQFVDAALGIDERREVLYLAPATAEAVPVDWAEAVRLDAGRTPLADEPAVERAEYARLPAAATQPRSYGIWEKSFSRAAAHRERLELWRHPVLRLTSRPGESDRDFRVRVQQAARSARDTAIDAVRKKYAARERSLSDRLRRAEAALTREQQQASGQKMQTAVSFGATLLGALFARKATGAGTIGRATTTARGVGRSMKEASDVKRATENIDAIRAAAAQLEEEIAADIAAITARFEEDTPLEPVGVRPKRGHVEVQFVALGWVSETVHIPSDTRRR
jgi:hypothetical protein